MIIDIRDIFEFKKRPTKAINIPEYLIKSKIDELKQVDTQITIICTTGLKAKKIVWYLEKFNIFAKADNLKNYYENN